MQVLVSLVWSTLPPDGRGNLLRWAAKSGQGELLELLLTRGADPGLEDDQGRTAADLAREAGHDDLAGRLQEASGAPRAPET